AAWDGTVRLWDATTQRQINLFKHEELIVHAVAFSSDGQQLVSVARGLDYPSRGTVSVWELAKGRLRYSRQTSRNVTGNTRVAVNRDASVGGVATDGASAEVYGLAFGPVSRSLWQPSA